MLNKGSLMLERRLRIVFIDWAGGLDGNREENVWIRGLKAMGGRIGDLVSWKTTV